jgi:hypothetical protein
MKGYIKSDGIGSCLIGRLHATYDEIVAVLGRPHTKNDMGSKANWMYEQRNIPFMFTLCDYKLDDKTIKLKDITEWSIGTKGNHIRSAFDLFKELFPNNKITDPFSGIVQDRKYVVKVALGETMTDKAENDEQWFKKVEPNDNDIVVKVFDTLKEANAFRDGLELMDGWVASPVHMLL